MCSPTASVGPLLTKAALGWQPGQGNAGEQVAQCWREHLRAETHAVACTARNQTRFVTALNDLRIKGMDQVSCLLLTGEGAGLSNQIRDFWQDANAPGRIYHSSSLSLRKHILRPGAFSPADGASSCPPPTCCLQLLDAETPRDVLASFLRRQVPRRRLVPYDYTRPASANMFFGRTDVIDRLRSDEDRSVAIVGPSRIGKTSVVRHYRAMRSLDSGSAAARRFYIDFYSCPPDDDAVARHVAMAIASSKRSHEMTLPGLSAFLALQCSRLNGPLELIMDEVDEVCNSKTFGVLGQEAKQGACRLILCGRGELFRLASKDRSTFGGRLPLLSLKPLDEQAARDLLIRPLIDLGLELREGPELVGRLLAITGRMPHLLQYYGMRLVELALEEGSGAISPSSLERLRSDFVSAQYFVAPLRDLSPDLRLAALLILRANTREWTPEALRSLLQQDGIECTYDRAFDSCNALVINNILAWHNDSYGLAHDLLAEYARKFGFLDDRVVGDARDEALSSHLFKSCSAISPSGGVSHGCV